MKSLNKNSKPSLVYDLNQLYFQQQILNLEQHYANWQKINELINEGLKNIIINPNNKTTFEQESERVLDFGISLTGLLSLSMGLNHKSTSIYLSNDYDFNHKLHIKILHNYFMINNKEEYYENLNNILKLKEAQEIARLSLIYDVKKHKNLIVNLDEQKKDEINDYDINFAFISYFKPSISLNFTKAHFIVETILYTRLGYDLGFLNQTDLFEITSLKSYEMVNLFSSWKDFLKNYILGVVFMNLDITNPNNSILVANKLIDKLPKLIEDYGLNKIDQWPFKINKKEV